MAVRKTLKSAYQIEEKKPQKWGVTIVDFHNTAHWRDTRDKYKMYRNGKGETRCDICGKDFPYRTRMAKGGKMITYLAREIDHILPVSMGGSIDDYNNLQQLCPSCHSRKTDKEIKERQ